MLDVKGDPSVKLEKIYLLDSAGNKVTSKRYYGDKIKEDTAIFHKNSPGVAAKKDATLFDNYYFPFAKNYQVLVFGQYQNNMQYQILVLYSSKNKTSKKEITLSNDAVHPLCTLNKELWGGKEKPVALTL